MPDVAEQRKCCCRVSYERDDGGGVVSEENFLRYRLQIVQKMADGPLKVAIVTAIATRAEVLREALVVLGRRTDRSGHPPKWDWM
jgi:hypothetical protein